MSANPFPVFDGHNDSIMHYALPKLLPNFEELFPDWAGKEPRTFFQRSDMGHIDLPRAKEGNLGGGFFAVSAIPETNEGKFKVDSVGAKEDGTFEIPLPPPIRYDFAVQTTMGILSYMFKMEEEAAGQAKIVRTADELAACLRDGVFAILVHFEGAEMIDTDFNALEVYYQAGLRSLGMVWSRPNAFGHGVPFKFPSLPDTGPGLTDAGKALVKACNELGVLVDLAHLNEKGFWDVAKITDAPLVSTHSSVHALSPVTRNLTDKQLDAIKESDGMVGVNFHVGFLREDGKSDANTPLETVVRHFDYMVERLGIDRVGFGSDFDGAVMPEGISDCSKLPNLIGALRKAGYDDEALRKLTHENWVRVFRKIWK